MKGLHVFDARWCVRHHHARSLNNIIALRPFLNEDLETGATLLVHHIVYHGCLGVKLHHVYVEPGQAEILLQNCQLAQLHRAQRVVFFEWPMRQFDGVVGPDRYGGHEISVRIQYWQMVQNNHALLTYWGTGAKVALLDIDEFLYGPAFGAAAQGTCLQHVYMACKDCQSGITEYAQVWSNHSTSWALQQYEVDGYSEDPVYHAKCWFSAEADVVHGVHIPTLQADDLRIHRPSLQSAGVLHFTSLWLERQSSPNDRSTRDLELSALHDEEFGLCLAESSYAPDL